MGVYIKGMEMPKRCVDCACYDRLRGDEIYTRDGCNALGMRFNENVSYGANIHDPFEGIYKDCPLVPVKTPHGRLIDADALKTAIHETEFYYDSTEEKCKRHDIGRLVHTLIDGIIDKSPTLIDAEEG